MPRIEEVRDAWKDLAGLTGFQVAGFLLSMLYLTLVSRSLGPAGFGIMTVFLSVVHLAFNIGVNWGQTAIVRFGKEELIHSGRIAETFWARNVLLAGGLVPLGVTALVAWPRIEAYLGEAAPLGWLLGPFLIVFSAADIAAWTLQAVGRMRAYAVSLVTRQAVVVLGGFALIGGWLPVTVGTVLTIEALGYVALIAIAATRVPIATFRPVRVRLARVREIWRYSWPLLGSLVAGYLATWAHVVVINGALGARDVGVYQAAYRFVFVLSEGTGALATVLLPLVVALQVYGQAGAVTAFYVPRLTPQLSFVWSIGVMVLVVAGPALVPLLWGTAYAETSSAFTWLIGGLAFQMVTLMYGVLLSARGLLGSAMVVNIVISVLNVAALLVTVPRWGLIAAATVTVACAAASAVGYLWIGNRAVGLATWRAMLGPVVVVLMLGACVVWSEAVPRVFAAIVLGIVAVVAAKRVRLFDATDVRWFEMVAMPRPMRRSVRAAYAWLS